VHEIAQRRAANGHDLIEITNRVLQADVRQLARDFRFPQIGAHVEQMTLALALNKGVEPHVGLFVLAVPGGGLAARAGLSDRDVIIAIGDTPVANHLDFELGLFKVRNQRIVPLIVQRPSVGTLTLDLPLR
jgi:S1-C subfamily serine protease